MTDDAPAGEARIDADTRTRAGVYANHVEIVLSDREVTLDFLRLDYAGGPPGRPVLVARVALEFATVLELEHTLYRMAPLWQKHLGPVP